MTATIASFDAALELAEMSYHVHPLKPGGKAPATDNGHLDATTNPAEIAKLWRTRRQANIRVALKASGVLVVGPDCAKWLKEFERRGLPDTMIGQSGSGPEHRHYYYRLPDGCPIHRLCIAMSTTSYRTAMRSHLRV